jgi:hypothetical protein
MCVCVPVAFSHKSDDRPEANARLNAVPGDFSVVATVSVFPPVLSVVDAAFAVVF